MVAKTLDAGTILPFGTEEHAVQLLTLQVVTEDEYSSHKNK